MPKNSIGLARDHFQTWPNAVYLNVPHSGAISIMSQKLVATAADAVTSNRTGKSETSAIGNGRALFLRWVVRSGKVDVHATMRALDSGGTPLLGARDARRMAHALRAGSSTSGLLPQPSWTLSGEQGCALTSRLLRNNLAPLLHLSLLPLPPLPLLQLLDRN